MRKELKPKTHKVIVQAIVKGDIIPDEDKPHDFAQAWKVESVQQYNSSPFQVLTLARRGIKSEKILPKESSIEVYEKPKGYRVLTSKVDYMKDLLWLLLFISVITNLILFTAYCGPVH